MNYCGLTRVALVVVYLFTLLTGSEAIWCFQCNSAYDADCAHIKFNDTTSRHYKPCDGTHREQFCRKMEQTIHDRDGLVRVVRRCGWIKDEKNRDCYSVSNMGHKDKVCQCFTDACNKAPSFQTPTHLLIPLILATFYVF